MCKPILTTPTFLPIWYLQAIYHSRPHAAFMKKVDNIPRHKASNKLITIPAISKDLKLRFLFSTDYSDECSACACNLSGKQPDHCKQFILQTSFLANTDNQLLSGKALISCFIASLHLSVKYMIETRILPFWNIFSLILAMMSTLWFASQNYFFLNCLVTEFFCLGPCDFSK